MFLSHFFTLASTENLFKSNYFVCKVLFLSVMSVCKVTLTTKPPFSEHLNTILCIHVSIRIKTYVEVNNMSNGKTIGMIVFVAGIVILLGYGLYQGFENLNLENIDAVVAIGVGAIIIGLLVLFATIIMEQQKGKKKMNEEIKKEDLEP